MASEKGCRQPADGKYWLDAVQEVVKSFRFRTSIRTNEQFDVS